MMNKIACMLIAAALMSSMLTACGNDDSSKRPSLLDEINNSSKTDEGGEEDEGGYATGYEWVIEPTIEAENIIAPDGAQVNDEEVENNAYYRVAIIKRDGMYGFVDYKGGILVKPEYTDYYIGYDGMMTLSRVTADGTQHCSIDASGNIVYNAPDRQIKDRYFFYDEAGKQCYYQNYKDSFAKEYTGKRTVAVQSVEVEKTGDNEYRVNIVDENFALSKGSELITDFEYEDAYLPVYKGTGGTCIALEKGGKWGYFNSDGKQIIDFICDAVPQASLASDLNVSEGLHPYLYAGKYVAVATDKGFGYYNKKGKVVVTPGEFEQARPVLNGLAWVRKGGLWGIIQIGKIDESLNITTTTTTTTAKPTTTEAYTGTWGTTTYSETTTTAQQADEEKTTKKTKKTKQKEETEKTTKKETKEVTEKQTQAAQTDPPETEPVETEPAETEPVETDPPQTEPVETEPAETEPVETEPVENEPAPAEEPAQQAEE